MIGKTFSVERNTEVVSNEKASRTIVRFRMLVLMLVFVYDSGKGSRYQIITDTHRNHATGRYSADSIVPQDHAPLSEVRYSKIRYGILARMDGLVQFIGAKGRKMQSMNLRFTVSGEYPSFNPLTIRCDYERFECPDKWTAIAYVV